MKKRIRTGKEVRGATNIKVGNGSPVSGITADGHIYHITINFFLHGEGEEVREMERCKRTIRSLVKSAEQIKADPTVPEALKKAFLDINRVLRAELKRYAEAQETLGIPYRQPGDILARARAKGQIQDTKALIRNLKSVMDQSERKNIPVIGKEVKEKGLRDRQRS